VICALHFLGNKKGPPNPSSGFEALVGLFGLIRLVLQRPHPLHKSWRKTLTS
jgi:hypothetical protein